MSKQCAIFETLNPISEMKIEKTGDGLMTLSGTFGVCGVRNNNQRVYETSNYSKMVSEMQSRIKENGAIPGELEHPSTMNITLENISHKVTDINIDENGVVSGTIQLLNTPKGKIAQAIVEGGLPLFVSSRAMGQVDKSGKVTLEKLSTYDLVGTPGFSQAKMHLNESQVCESLSDNIFVISDKNEEPIDNNVNENNENNDDMNQEILDKIELLESRVNDLEQENQDLKDQLDEAAASKLDLKKLADGIQQWITEEYSPVVQQWVLEQAAPETVVECKKMIVKEVGPKIQQWVVEEFAPEVEKWVLEEYSPNISDWVTGEVAPGIQNWLVEHFAPEIDAWINESHSFKVKEMISENLSSNTESKLKSISETLSLLEGIDVQKPSFGGRMINENSNNNEPVYIAQMPEAARVKYNMASQEIKESIDRRAKLYDFTTEGAIERFWNNINFEEIKPVANLYEGLENIKDLRERQIRAGFRRHRQLW